jgi:hypothetical protein
LGAAAPFLPLAAKERTIDRENMDEKGGVRGKWEGERGGVGGAGGGGGNGCGGGTFAPPAPAMC